VVGDRHGFALVYARQCPALSELQDDPSETKKVFSLLSAGGQERPVPYQQIIFDEHIV
jgi:hypothetical protein